MVKAMSMASPASSGIAAAIRHVPAGASKTVLSCPAVLGSLFSVLSSWLPAFAFNFSLMCLSFQDFGGASRRTLRAVKAGS